MHFIVDIFITLIKIQCNARVNKVGCCWCCWNGISRSMNRPFPSSLVPLFQNESKCETFLMKMSSACDFIFMQIKVIFIRMVSHLDSLWNGGTGELGNGLFTNTRTTLRMFDLNLVKWCALRKFNISAQFLESLSTICDHFKILRLNWKLSWFFKFLIVNIYSK